MAEPVDKVKAIPPLVRRASDSECRVIMEQQIEKFLSRCGVLREAYSFDNFRTLDAVIDGIFTWRLDVTVNDEPVDRNHISSSVLMNIKAMDEQTRRIRDKLREDTEALNTIAAKDSRHGFAALVRNTKFINMLHKQELVGYAVCQNCHGAKEIKCHGCDGTGKITCPDCHGKGVNCPRCYGHGYVTCPECSGSGKVNCPSCHGKGQIGVRRTIVQQIVRSNRFDFKIGEGESKIDPAGLSDDMKAALTQGTAFDLAEEEAASNSHMMDFRGLNTCHEIMVHLRGVDAPFLYTTCGDGCDPISKPQLFDFVSQAAMSEIGEIASDTKRDFNERRVAACNALEANEVLTRTVRGMDTILTSVLESHCRKAGIDFLSVTDPEDWRTEPDLRAIISKARPEYIARVSVLLRQNASYFISKEFADAMAANLVNLVPFMARENPGTVMMWNAASILAWFVTGLIMFLFPSPGMALVLFLLSAVLAVGVSLMGTRNLLIYIFTSKFGITHLGRRIPNMKPDIMSAVKFLVINLFVIMIIAVLNG